MAKNTLDALATENGRSIVKHYLQDVGSTFGMCNDHHEWGLSWEDFVQGDTTRKRLFSFGFALTPCRRSTTPSTRRSASSRGDRFDPRKWRPQSPTTAYLELRDDDAFWAARRVAAFTDELIRAAVHTGQYSDPMAEKYLPDVLITRRDKITSTYLTAVNPIVAPWLDANGRLTFENAAVAASVASGPAAYRASWFRFDTATGETQALSDTQSPTTTIEAPSGVPTASGSFVAVDISADSEGRPAWRRPIRTYFRRGSEGWDARGARTVAREPLTRGFAHAPPHDGPRR